MIVIQMPPVHAANLVANSGNTAYGVDVIGPTAKKFDEVLINIKAFWLKKMHLKMPSAKWRPFCLGLNVWTHFSDHICLSDETNITVTS